MHTALRAFHVLLAALLAVASSAASGSPASETTAKSLVPHVKDVQMSLTVTPGVLSITPHGPATLYEDTRNSVTITADRRDGKTALAIVANHSGSQSSEPTPAAAPVALAKPAFPFREDGDIIPAEAPSAPAPANSVAAASAASTRAKPAAAPVAAAAAQTQNIPVILVHGTWSNSETEFDPALLPALQAAGFQTFTYGYGYEPGLPINLIKQPAVGQPGAEAPIQDSTQDLANEIALVEKETGATQVDLVGASQGGLVIKNYLSTDAKNDIANVVDINATNHGTTLGELSTIIDTEVSDQAMDQLFSPVHTLISNVATGIDGALAPADPAHALQDGIDQVASVAESAVQLTQNIIKVPINLVQNILREVVSLVAGPAAAQQALGSDFLKQLDATPDTKPGVNYLVLATTNDATETPYNLTYLKAGTGSSVTNIEEHSLPGVSPTDQIGHVDLPTPVVNAIVNYLSGTPVTPGVPTLSKNSTDPGTAAAVAKTPGVTVTVDGGTTTVQSGANTLYSGSSSATDAVDNAVQQALGTTAPTQSANTAASSSKNNTAPSSKAAEAPEQRSIVPAATTGATTDATSPHQDLKTGSTSTANAGAAAAEAKNPQQRQNTSPSAVSTSNTSTGPRASAGPAESTGNKKTPDAHQNNAKSAQSDDKAKTTNQKPPGPSEARGGGHTPR